MMGISTFHSFNIPRVNNFHINPLKPANYSFKRIPTVFSSYTDTDTASVSDPTTPFQNMYKVEFKTLEGCKLGIWRYPIFEYNAKGGIGNGIGREKNDIIDVDFDVNNLYIPSLNGDTTKFIGLPLPPFLKIDIVPEILQGNINRSTGKVDLVFKSRFWFSVGSIYKAPPLLVETVLTSEESVGNIRSGTGETMNEKGRCKLVGVAVVDPITDAFMNNFLRLPTECIAYLNAVITFSIANCQT
ncbi:ATP-dependent Clp protease ATP-binding subunit [Carex rostrata]